MTSPYGPGHASGGAGPDSKHRLIGHRGSGKTSTAEAILFEAGATSRLGWIGDGSTVLDASLRVVDAAAVVVSGVNGVEVNTERLWERADSEGLARLVFVNMLDRERADFFTTLESLKEAFGAHVVATEIPIGLERDVRGVVSATSRAKRSRTMRSSPRSKMVCAAAACFR